MKNKIKALATGIPIAEAKRRTANWRKVMQPLFKNKRDIPKGFYIPFADIIALSELYPQAAGARAYFSLQEASFQPGQGVSAVLVPVAFTDTMEYKDIIIPEAGEGADGDNSSVYDFTKPCPDCCDVVSDLYD